MTPTVQQIFEEALTLPEASRLALAERLLESVAPSPHTVADQMTEVRQRITDMEARRVQPVSGPEGLNRVRETLLNRAAA